MIIKNITIKNFRNIGNQKIEFCDGINVIEGKNAQGKTNILEALWLFSGQKSFRGAKDNEMIKIGESAAALEIEFFSEERDQTASLSLEKGKEYLLNGVLVDRQAALFEKIPQIVFSPDDLSLISEGPFERRRFCDSVIGSFYPRYNEKINRYNRALEQRKFVLKDYRFHPELDFLLDDFEAEIVKSGAEIILYRKRFLNKLSLYCPKIYSEISGGKEDFSLEYISTSGESEKEFSEMLKSLRENDSLTLTTSVGPHRDDIDIKIGGISARKFGSQGQKRSGAITLKLAEAKLAEEIFGTNPIILLDDVMSELDPSRQEYILNHIKDTQVFITCCDPENIKGLIAGKVIKVENGEVK